MRHFMAKERNKTKTPPSAGQPRTAERRKERVRERRRQQLITGGIIIAAVVVVAVFVVLVVNAPADAPIPEAALTRYEDMQQSRTQPEGYPRLGEASAPVQVAEYSSFDCPHCRDFHDQSIDPIVERVRDGRMAFTYVPLHGFGSITNGQGAAAAAVCAAEQGKFWEFHDALFDWQGQFGNQAFTNNRILSGVEALELDRSAYNACIASGRPGEVLNTAQQAASVLIGFNGTPTITINGVVPLGDDQQPLADANAIIARIDEELARVSAPTAEETPEATAETTPEPTVEVPEAVPTEDATPEATAST
jgi:protein-disulfide isomerase